MLEAHTHGWDNMGSWVLKTVMPMAEFKAWIIRMGEHQFPPLLKSLMRDSLAHTPWVSGVQGRNTDGEVGTRWLSEHGTCTRCDFGGTHDVKIVMIKAASGLDFFIPVEYERCDKYQSQQ